MAEVATPIEEEPKSPEVPAEEEQVALEEGGEPTAPAPRKKRKKKPAVNEDGTPRKRKPKRKVPVEPIIGQEQIKEGSEPKAEPAEGVELSPAEPPKKTKKPKSDGSSKKTTKKAKSPANASPVTATSTADDVVLNYTSLPSAPDSPESDKGAGRGSPPSADRRASQTNGASTAAASAPSSNVNSEEPLDLVFICDCTSSMGKYLTSAKENIQTIIREITAAEKSVRFALVKYRDHPPEEKTYVIQTSDWTSSVDKMFDYVKDMQALGGGDGPEAVVDALDAVNKLKFRSDAVRVCVFISDAPPHGIEPSKDHFPKGCPCGLDPIKVLKDMAKNDIVIYAVGAEPELGKYKHGRDFMFAAAKLTGGRMVPLTSASLLGQVIIGGAVEEISMKKMEKELEADIGSLLVNNEKLSEEELVSNLTNRLNQKKYTTNQLQVDDIYGNYDMKNVNILIQSSSLSDAKPKLTKEINTSINTSAYTTIPGFDPEEASRNRYGSLAGLPPRMSSGPALSEGSTSPPIRASGSRVYDALPPPRASSSNSLPGSPAPSSPVLPDTSQRAHYSQLPVSRDQVSRLVNRNAQKGKGPYSEILLPPKPK